MQKSLKITPQYLHELRPTLMCHSVLSLQIQFIAKCGLFAAIDFKIYDYHNVRHTNLIIRQLEDYARDN